MRPSRISAKGSSVNVFISRSRVDTLSLTSGVIVYFLCRFASCLKRLLRYAFTAQLEPISSFVTMTGMNFLMPLSHGGRAEGGRLVIRSREWTSCATPTRRLVPHTSLFQKGSHLLVVAGIANVCPDCRHLRLDENCCRATDNDCVANLLRRIVGVFRSRVDDIETGR